MSDETALKLEEARAVAAGLLGEADARVRESLTAVARRIPGLVDDIAKRAAHSQPEVAKQLGSSGIKDLRRRLADEAANIASEVEAAAKQTEGRSAQSELSMVEPRNVEFALFRFLDGRRVDSLAAVLKRHGFSIQDDNVQGSQGLILAQHLYSEGDFVAVAQALSSLARAEKAVAVARATNDRDIVDALWDDK